jgi:hypothetical protein
MSKEQRILKARQAILPKVEAYAKTRKPDGSPGCKKTLARAVNAFNETKEQFENWGIKMPSANQIGYGDIRDQLNADARHYGLIE